MRHTEPNCEAMARRKHTSSHFHLDDAKGAVVFSFVDDGVWASWPGRSGSVHLGHYDIVTYMMRDFLAQCDLGERMAQCANGNGKRLAGSLKP